MPAVIARSAVAWRRIRSRSVTERTVAHASSAPMSPTATSACTFQSASIGASSARTKSVRSYAMIDAAVPAKAPIGPCRSAAIAMTKP